MAHFPIFDKIKKNDKHYLGTSFIILLFFKKVLSFKIRFQRLTIKTTIFLAVDKDLVKMTQRHFTQMNLQMPRKMIKLKCMQIFNIRTKVLHTKYWPMETMLFLLTVQTFFIKMGLVNW